MYANENQKKLSKGDMLSWFRNVNLTKIQPSKGFLSEAKENYAQQMHLNNYMQEVHKSKAHQHNLEAAL